MGTFVNLEPPMVRVDCWADGIDDSGWYYMARGGSNGVIADPGEQMEVVSGNANDGLAGTGARTMRILYLEAATGLLKTEVVAMQGQTPVSTVALNIQAILGFFVETTGSNNANVGVITLRKQGTVGTDDRAEIPANRNTWAPGQYAVPAGRLAVFRGFWATYGAGNNNIKYRVVADVNPYDGTRNEGIFQVLGNCETRRKAEIPGDVGPGLLLPPRTILRVQVQGPSSATRVAGALLVEVQ